MEKKVIILFFLLSLFSCKKENYMMVSGQIENFGTRVSIWLRDSIYIFELDENKRFSGKIELEESAYASFVNTSDIYLSPGETLEIYGDLSTPTIPLSFSGSLGAINNYLQEQERVVYFDKDYYYLEEKDFVNKINQLIEDKVRVLESKNFSKEFTDLEKLRIRYSLGERATVYPFFHAKYTGHNEEHPGKDLNNLLSTFSPDNEELFVTKNYQQFLFNYMFYRGKEFLNHEEKDYLEGLVEYVMLNFKDVGTRNFLLIDFYYRYIWENNGIENAEFLIEVIHKYCQSAYRYPYVQKSISNWEKLLPGNKLPGVEVENINEESLNLNENTGSYIYMGVWASWCELCKNEFKYLKKLEQDYEGKNLKIVTVTVDELKNKNNWKYILESNNYGGIHYISKDNRKFYNDFMIISIPRFFLISPEGIIISSNAPRPSGQIRRILDSLSL